MAEPLPLLLIPGRGFMPEQIPAEAIRARRDRRLHARLEHGCDCGAHPRRRAGINLGMLHLNPPRHVSVHRKSLGRREGMLDRPRIARSRIQTSSLSG